MSSETMLEVEKRTSYVVMYRPTGKTFPNQIIAKGRHGQATSPEDAAELVKQCDAHLNTRMLEPARFDDKTGVKIKDEKTERQENAIIWIDEYEHEWDAEKERLKPGKRVVNNEPKKEEPKK